MGTIAGNTYIINICIEVTYTGDIYITNTKNAYFFANKIFSKHIYIKNIYFAKIDYIISTSIRVSYIRYN